MRYERDPESQKVTMDALGALKRAWEFFTAWDTVQDTMRGHGKVQSNVTTEVLAAHTAFSSWLRGDPTERDVPGWWYCYVEEEVIPEDALAEHLETCDGGGAAEHWPLVAQRKGEPVTRRNYQPSTSVESS